MITKGFPIDQPGDLGDVWGGCGRTLASVRRTLTPSYPAGGMAARSPCAGAASFAKTGREEAAALPDA